MKQLIEVVPMERAYRRGLMLHHVMMETFENMTTAKELTQAYSKVDSSLELMNGQAQSEKVLGRIKEVKADFLLRIIRISLIVMASVRTHMLILYFNCLLP